MVGDQVVIDQVAGEELEVERLSWTSSWRARCGRFLRRARLWFAVRLGRF